MNEYTIREQRKNDVLESFYNAMKAIGYSKSCALIDEVVSVASRSRAPRFYTTVEKAQRYISIIEKGESLPLENPNKIKMYEDIYNQYVQMREQGYRKCIAIENALRQEAPSFYLSQRTFRDIVYKKLNKK